MADSTPPIHTGSRPSSHESANSSQQATRATTCRRNSGVSRLPGDQAGGKVVTTEKAKDGRPDIRKVVGEGVVLNVKERTATVVVTRTAQEIHTGDWVEIQ